MGSSNKDCAGEFCRKRFSVLQIIAMAGKAAGPTVGSTLRVDVRLLLHIRNIVAM